MVEYILVHGIRVAKSFEPETFGRLTTIGPQFKLPIGKTGSRTSYQVCECSCGRVTIAMTNNLNRNHTTSCGCRRKDAAKELKTTHGESSKTPEYKIWINMHTRCNNPKNKSYADYGGRGIAVCIKWSGPFGYKNFLDDMGRRPSPRHSLDRKNTNGEYSPENCRWATPSEQANNRRSSRVLTYNGKSQTLTQWSVESGLGYCTIKMRLKRGWSVEKALNTPRQKGKKKCQH
jgi:hypothetical protein